jgi:hypothetical protein
MNSLVSVSIATKDCRTHTDSLLGPQACSRMTQLGSVGPKRPITVRVCLQKKCEGGHAPSQLLLDLFWTSLLRVEFIR